MEMLRSMSQAGYSKGQLMTSRPGSGPLMSPLDPSMQPSPQTTPAAAHVSAGTDPKPSPAVLAEPMSASLTSAAEEPNEGAVAALGTDALQLPSLGTEANQQQQELQQRTAAAAARAPLDISQPEHKDVETSESATDMAAVQAQDFAAARSAAAEVPSTVQPLGEQNTQTAAVAAQQTVCQGAPAATERGEAAGAPEQDKGLVAQQGVQPGAQAEADVPDMMQPAMHGSTPPDMTLQGLTAPEEAEAHAAAETAPAELAAAADDMAAATDPSQPEMHEGPAEAEGEAVPQETAPQEPVPGAVPRPEAGAAAGAPGQMTPPAEGVGTPAQTEPQLPTEAAAATPLAAAALEESLAQSRAVASPSEVLHEPTADEAQPGHHVKMEEPFHLAVEASSAPAADEGIAAIPQRSTQGNAPTGVETWAKGSLHGQSAHDFASGNSMLGSDQVEAEEAIGVSRDADSPAEAASEFGRAQNPDC